jgi:hypothetical protein
MLRSGYRNSDVRYTLIAISYADSANDTFWWMPITQKPVCDRYEMWKR